MTGTETRERPARSARRTQGLACAAAGVLGALSAGFSLVVPPAVPTDVYSYPLDTGGFTVIQLWFFLQHLGLLAGIIGVGSTVAGSRWGRGGAAVAGLAMLGLAVTELWAITEAESPYPSRATAPLDTAYGVTSLACGLGLVVLGVVVARRRVDRGTGRWWVLLTGVWVFVPMTPLILLGQVGGRVGIGGWMLLFALLGWNLAREARD